jgi:hypothetical protein
LDHGGLCDAAAEWVALGGHSYELTPVPRCLDHALAARRAGCYIRPISKDEFATGSLGRLTPDAYAQGPATALPQEVQLAPELLLARPTGVGHALTTDIVTIPLEGRAEWLAAAGVRSA